MRLMVRVTALASVLAVACCGGPDATRSGTNPSESPGTGGEPTAAADPTRPVSGASETSGSLRWSLDAVRNLTRLGTLTERQRELLIGQGFFLAPQPEPTEHPTPEEARTAHRATHLFHVYERNDYIAMPSFVTADVAIDVTHAYFEAVLRDVETDHLDPLLREALRSLVGTAERLRAGARSAEARRHATRAVAFWAIALRLLEEPASGDPPEIAEIAPPMGAEEWPSAGPGPRPPPPTPVPASVRTVVQRVVARAHAHAGEERLDPLLAPLDFSQMRPRGNYTRTGVLARYFRAMSWLGMASFPVEGESADVEAVTMLARCLLGDEVSARKLASIVGVTSFFAGGPDAASLAEAAARLRSLDPASATATADTLLEPALLQRYGAALRELPAPRITAAVEGGSRQIRVAGRRAFEDSVAMQRLIEPLVEALRAAPDGAVAVTMMGALGSAAVLGSGDASGLIARATPETVRPALVGALDQARADMAALPAERFGQDAYHATLHALRALLERQPRSAPDLLRTDAWRTRALFSFAGGWAQLRHATILYGAQMGAECDAPEPEPPWGWVEPLPTVYERLSVMVRALSDRLTAAGVPMDREQMGEGGLWVRPLAEKAQLLAGLLEFLRETSEIELRGEALDREHRQRITLLGGEIEWLLISLANTELLSERDQDMAIVADVFTLRQAQQAVEVGIAHPDLVYALVPAPGGPVVARGAVMSYRETLHPTQDRLTDEQWRALVAAGRAPDRPRWARPLFAEPVEAVRLADPQEGVDRCGPMTGASFEI